MPLLRCPEAYKCDLAMTLQPPGDSWPTEVHRHGHIQQEQPKRTGTAFESDHQGLARIR